MPLFGPPNIEKLLAKKNIQGLIRAMDYKKDTEVRCQAAEALVALYSAGRLGSEQKQTILALRDTIVAGEHHDTHTDIERPGACFDIHEDTSITVDFPL